MCYLLAALKNFLKETAAIQRHIVGPHNVSNVLLTLCGAEDYSDPSLVGACIGLEEFAEVCDAKNSKVYLVL